MGKGHLWAEPTPLKNDGVRKCWDDDIPNMMGKIKFMFQTTKQMGYGWVWMGMVYTPKMAIVMGKMAITLF